MDVLFRSLDAVHWFHVFTRIYNSIQQYIVTVLIKIVTVSTENQKRKNKQSVRHFSRNWMANYQFICIYQAIGFVSSLKTLLLSICFIWLPIQRRSMNPTPHRDPFPQKWYTPHRVNIHTIITNSFRARERAPWQLLAVLLESMQRTTTCEPFEQLKEQSIWEAGKTYNPSKCCRWEYRSWSRSWSDTEEIIYLSMVLCYCIQYQDIQWWIIAKCESELPCQRTALSMPRSLNYAFSA